MTTNIIDIVDQRVARGAPVMPTDRVLMRSGKSNKQVAAAIGLIWYQRADRYSEIRTLKKQREGRKLRCLISVLDAFIRTRPEFADDPDPFRRH